jgi:hypothetical protein
MLLSADDILERYGRCCYLSAMADGAAAAAATAATAVIICLCHVWYMITSARVSVLALSAGATVGRCCIRKGMWPVV